MPFLQARLSSTTNDVLHACLKLVATAVLINSQSEAKKGGGRREHLLMCNRALNPNPSSNYLYGRVKAKQNNIDSLGDIWYAKWLD